MALIGSCRSNQMLLVIAAGAALSLAVGSAAADAPVSTRLVWDGSVCGSAEDFAARIGRRTNVARFVQRGQRLLVRARIARRGEALEASASIEAPGRAPIVRRLDSSDCNDALDALALVVAIGIEGRGSAPRTRRRPAAAPAAPRETGPEITERAAGAAPAELSEPPGKPAPLGTPSTEAPPRAAAEPSTPPRSALEPPPAVAPPPRTRSVPAPRASAVDRGSPAAPLLDVGAGLSAALSVGVAPSPLFGAGLWISAGWPRQSVWSPELVLGAQHQRLDGLTRADGRADFALTFGSVSLCPLRWGNSGFELRPCVAGALGRLDVQGHATFDARSWQRPWWALGGTLEGLARAGVIELRAVLGATAPLVRDSFVFEGPCADAAACEADVFHHVAPVIWSGALGAGIRIW